MSDNPDPAWLRFRRPRVWSNGEIRRFAPLFRGSVVNVSAWTDEDKEGGFYREYFSSASEYRTTNFSDGKGLQRHEGEVFLDLEAPLPDDLVGRFELVFNHTTLEHVFDCRRAFANIAAMSKNAVMVVVPYIQQMHGSGYGDFWRFTPQAMERLYEENGMTLRYCSANGADRASIYLFCLGFRGGGWPEIPERFDLALDPDKPLYGPDYRNVIGGNVLD
jgi:hypothetical protein